MNILVTNAKNRIAYNILKSLSVKGHHVYCADFIPKSMSFYSRYSSGHFLYPSPFREQEKFVACLIEKISELKIDVLIPVFEELFLVSRHLDEISRHVKLVVPDYQQILIAHNKDKWAPIARQLNISVPVTCSLTEFDKDSALVDRLIFPVLLKPKQGGGGWGISQVDTVGELQNILSVGVHCALPLERFIVQQKITGEVICVAMVFNQGKLRGKTAYRQIREYPIFGGQATCRISVSCKAAEDNLQALLEHFVWHGVCQADFIVDSDTGEPYLIDINPRFWGSLAQGIASGVDFPDLVCRIAINGDVEPVVGFTVGVKTRWLGGELRGFFQHYARAANKLVFLREFFMSQVPVARFDDFSFNDPFPFIIWGWDSLTRIVRYNHSKPHDSLAGVWE